MTGFKELARIDEAIEHGNRSELLWAKEYCTMRLGIAPRKDHQKYWTNLRQKVISALSDKPDAEDDSE